MTRDNGTTVAVDELARRAADGDRDALTALIRQIQHPMYRLALRFLGHPQDAEDACQEILIRIVTRLGTFEGRSAFTTWAYTVEPAAQQLDEITAIGDLYRFDRFTAPASLWDDLQRRYPELLGTG